MFTIIRRSSSLVSDMYGSNAYLPPAIQRLALGDYLVKSESMAHGHNTPHLAQPAHQALLG